jgi:hypothetical protein
MIPPTWARWRRCHQQAFRVVAKYQLSRYTRIMAKLIDDIRRAVEQSGQSRYSIAKTTGVSAAQLSRLVNGHSGLHADTIEKIANHLGLEIVLRPKTTKGK